jgi:hypothetical protein
VIRKGMAATNQAIPPAIEEENIKVDFYPEGTKSNVFVSSKKKSFPVVKMG